MPLVPAFKGRDVLAVAVLLVAMATASSGDGVQMCSSSSQPDKCKYYSTVLH